MQLMATLLAALLCHAAMMALSLAMGRHYQQLTGKREVPARHRHLLRTSGWALLLLAATTCIRSFEISVGLTIWCALLTVAALTVACGLTYRPRLSARMAALALGIGLAGLSVHWALSMHTA